MSNPGAVTRAKLDEDKVKALAVKFAENDLSTVRSTLDKFYTSDFIETLTQAIEDIQLQLSIALSTDADEAALRTLNFPEALFPIFRRLKAKAKAEEPMKKAPAFIAVPKAKVPPPSPSYDPIPPLTFAHSDRKVLAEQAQAYASDVTSSSFLCQFEVRQFEERRSAPSAEVSPRPRPNDNAYANGSAGANAYAGVGANAGSGPVAAAKAAAGAGYMAVASANGGYAKGCVPPHRGPKLTAALSIEITYESETPGGGKRLLKCGSYTVPAGHSFVLAGSPTSPDCTDHLTVPLPPRLNALASPPTSPQFLPTYCAGCSAKLQPTHLDLTASTVSNSSGGSMQGTTPLQSPQGQVRSLGVSSPHTR